MDSKKKVNKHIINIYIDFPDFQIMVTICCLKAYVPGTSICLLLILCDLDTSLYRLLLNAF